MVQYTYVKQVNSARLILEVKAAGLPAIDHIDTSGATLLIYFATGLSSAQKSVLDTVVSNHLMTTTREMIDKIIADALIFSVNVRNDFVAENVMLGITQRRLTGHVRKMMREVKDAMDSGSLYDAITEIKSLNINDFDSVIVTPARILLFRNKIEVYLKVPLAQNWNDPETWM